MTNNVTIDGVNIYSTYGVYVSKGGYKEIAQWPAMKAVEGNNWQEYDGFEPDLSKALLESRQITINFILKGNVQAIQNFYDFLGGKPVRSFTFVDLGRTLSLRLVSMPNIKYAQVFHAMQVRFASDIPLEGYSYLAPSSSLPVRHDVEIDGTPLSAYGVRIIKGTADSLIIKPDVKPLLTRTSSVINGATYDENPLLNDINGTFSPQEYETIGGTYDGVSASWKRSKSEGDVTFAGRGLTLKCYLQDSTAKAWRNLDALLYDLTKANPQAQDSTLASARSIYLAELGKTYLSYYDSMAVDDFVCSGGSIWIKFSLSFFLFRAVDSEQPYLYIDPTTINMMWLTPWAQNNVYSNTDWNVQ